MLVLFVVYLLPSLFWSTKAFHGLIQTLCCICCCINCSLGGLVLASKDNQIVLDNTLDARMQIVFKQQLPEVVLV